MIKKLIIGLVTLLVLGVAYYGISPLFRNTYVDEVAPMPAQEVTVTSASTTQGEAVSTENESTPTEPTVPEVKTATVVDTVAHPASGIVRVINTDAGAVIRYENFKTINGPDLYVYLANDLEAEDYVSLGTLKATEGNVNYTVPEGVDVNDYKYVMVWCRQFGVLFNYADLTLTR